MILNCYKYTTTTTTTTTTTRTHTMGFFGRLKANAAAANALGKLPSKIRAQVMDLVKQYTKLYETELLIDEQTREIFTQSLTVLVHWELENKKLISSLPSVGDDTILFMLVNAIKYAFSVVESEKRSKCTPQEKTHMIVTFIVLKLDEILMMNQ